MQNRTRRIRDDVRRLAGGSVVWVFGLAAVLNAQPLERQIDALAARDGVTWVEYRVPMIGGGRQICCFDAGAERTCRLERGDGVAMTGPNDAPGPPAPVVIEPPVEMRVFARLEGGRVVRIRTFSLDCSVEAGGVPVARIDGVSVDESVRWLSGLVRDGAASAIAEPAVAAIGLHPGERALATLVELARQDARGRIRSRALFWLAQRAGEEAVKTIGDAVETDPEIAVKRQAVFALSQLPRNEGVPLLIEVARTHRQPDVRRQAMFWLGQSRDRRAVDFFEQILRAR